MRIHTDTITRDDLHRLLPDGVYLDVSEHGSRKRARAFEVSLFVFEKDALHRHLRNSGKYGASDSISATWDEWGVWFQRLYDIDRDAIIGWYETYSHFLSITAREQSRVAAQYKPDSLYARTHTAPWLDDYPHEAA
jgi:hypothetical protein